MIGPKGEQLGIVNIHKALEIADKFEQDLVEVAPQVRPPVCRIMDYSKYKYDQEKREREAKKHQKHSHLKEVRVRPKIAEHDYAIKLKHAIEFLKDGNKVKVSLMFRGRENAHREIGRRVVDRFCTDLQAVGSVEYGPAMEGRMINMIVAPK